MAQLSIGDVVKLKSGGPNMTVTSAPQGTTAYYCKWFLEGKTHSGRFEGKTLELVAKETKDK